MSDNRCNKHDSTQVLESLKEIRYIGFRVTLNFRTRLIIVERCCLQAFISVTKFTCVKICQCSTSMQISSPSENYLFNKSGYTHSYKP